MTSKVWAVAFAALVIGLAGPAAAQDTAEVARRTVGALTMENVPETPAAVRARLEQYVSTRSAGFQEFLPGGGMIIATRFGESTQLHHVATPMGARSQITFYEEPVSGADVRPGGGAFVFGKDVGGDENYAGLLYDVASGAVTQFTAPGTRNQSFLWRRDGRLAAWTQVPADSPNWDIMIADPTGADGGPRRVLAGQGAMAALDWSPDGRTLLIGRYISVLESKRYLLDIASGALTELTPDLAVSYGGGEFTADGRAVILTSDEGGEFSQLVRLDLVTGARTVLTPGLTWEVEGFDLSPDGRTLAYTINEAGQSRLALMDARTGRPIGRINRAISAALPVGVIGGLGFDDEGRRLGFTLNSATGPADAYSLDVRTGALTRWTQSEVGGLDTSRFVSPELISWNSFDGREISGFLYRPAGEGPHPVIVQIHGGPESQSRPTFSSTIQYWVNELGVAVISPNVRGSSGFGRTFLALDNAERREDSVRDIGALLDWIAAAPEFDAERVVVYGGSYGGYMVLASMVHFNDRLAGGVNIVGISNFVTFLENTSGYRQDLRRVEYGDERDPAMRETLQRISPLTNISRVDRPLFVIHGANDPRVPLSEAEQVTAAVRRNGGDVWLMVAADEGHGFRRRSNQEAQREAETLFFTRTLRLRDVQGSAVQ